MSSFRNVMRVSLLLVTVVALSLTQQVDSAGAVEDEGFLHTVCISACGVGGAACKQMVPFWAQFICDYAEEECKDWCDENLLDGPVE